MVEALSADEAAPAAAQPVDLEECEALILSPEERQALVDKALEHKAKGNAEFKNQNYADALASYLEAVAICPEDEVGDRAVFHANIAACHIHTKEYAKAVASCTEALKCKPDYQKALLRRAAANEKIGSWSSLTDSLADYKAIAAADPKNREAAALVQSLPKRIEVQQEKEKAEMMGKLKDLGNSFLGNFGLSLDSFQMKQDGSGGYSLNMKK
ncbi:cytochrome c oxidase subunit 1 [Geranomyces variabilis]|uniref:Cytochrome c oxidase subunit 1 n=1 Tax=Geranomyces variabilis TaxID=109894 RepID=A0AAD5XNY5_9FUNG|nr:cytochrome c oxidase subunit 1 [Geranomyces variabilis]